MVWPKLKRDYKGLTVKVVREIRNASEIVPVGRICTVDEWFRGLSLISPKCEHCGSRTFITRVPLSHVELIVPQNTKETSAHTHNSDYAAALWKELRRRNGGKFPGKQDWVAVTRERLNSAIKALQNCA
jgi:hypothetical protein